MSVQKISGPMQFTPGSSGINAKGQTGTWGPNNTFIPDKTSLPASNNRLSTANTTNNSGSGGGPGSSTGSSTGSGGKKMIDCPDCNGEVITNPKKKESKGLAALFPKMPNSVRVVLNDAQTLLGLKRTKGKEGLWDKGCPNKDCKGGKIEDKTDRTKQMQAAKQKAESAKEEITKLEAKLGPPGGNRHTLVVGDDFLQVGLGFNNSQSYTVIEDALIVPGGGSVEKKATLPKTTKCNAVVGANPVAIPGGNYTLQVGNKFTIWAGAQGIDISSKGAVSIHGGITKITGPEVTIGSGVGQVVVEGQHLQLNGKSIALTPDTAGNGHVAIQGNVHTTGNLSTTGGAHIEGDLSFISATCPSKVDRVEHASQDRQVIEGAVWGTQAQVQALQDFARTVQLRLTDVSGFSLSPRGIQNIIEDTKEMMKKIPPREIIPTGVFLPGEIIVQGQGNLGFPVISTNLQPVFFYNFPHHHKIPDLVHAHDMTVPNINIMENDEAVRGTAKAKTASPAPVPANLHQGETVLNRIKSTLQALAVFNYIR